MQRPHVFPSPRLPHVFAKGDTVATTNKLLVTIVSVVLLVGGCATVRGTAPVRIEQDSPQALARSFHEAATSKNFAAMLECMEPDKQALYDSLLVAARRFWEKVVPLAKLIEEKIGPDEAKRFLDGARENVLPSPFAEAVVGNKVNWSRVDFNVEAGKASASIDGITWFQATTIDGKWYMTHAYDNVSFEEVVRSRRTQFEAAAAASHTYSRRIRSGKINKDNVNEELFHIDKGERERQARWAATPYGPALAGVRIRMTAARKVFRKDERMWFHVAVKYDGDDRICWWIPGIGPEGSWSLGQNTLLEIDGKAVKRPDAKADKIWVAASGGSWPVYLPPGFRLRPGQHTVRYTIISPGGTYTDEDGRRYRVLNGKLVSNTLTFVVED